MNDQETTQLEKDIATLTKFGSSAPCSPQTLLVVTSTKNPIYLTVAQGNIIKALITKHCKINQTQYSDLINMDMALLSKYLSGELPITVQALARILSKISYNTPHLAIGFEAEWQTRIVIREYEIGKVVPNADCTEQESMSLLEDNG